MTNKEETTVALRMPAKLHETIVEIAKQELRSVNSELVWLLMFAVSRPAHRRPRSEWDREVPDV